MYWIKQSSLRGLNKQTYIYIYISKKCYKTQYYSSIGPTIPRCKGNRYINIGLVILL